MLPHTGDTLRLPSATLLFGPPGVGKTSLLTRVLREVAKRGVSCALVSAEQAVADVRRAHGLRRGELVSVWHETDAAAILRRIEHCGAAVVGVDSLSAAEGVSSARGCPLVAGGAASCARLAGLLKELAWSLDIAVIAILHESGHGGVPLRVRAQFERSGHTNTSSTSTTTRGAAAP